MKKYSIIYADPPWRYKVYSKKGLGRSAESHYPTMELEDIRALPVGTLAADDCVLFLWTTIPLLHDCFSVMRAWGFSYKTVAFVWIKQNRKSDSLFWGMGHWTRANAEFCMHDTFGLLMSALGTEVELQNNPNEVIAMSTAAGLDFLNF